ncbi:hypothetical protein FUA23_06335 [Neolewinella aurantiaca]|uniref:Uncharacterized protein n=1 Tax=Neolewinella aurantiaca TaxID=2602767 RepID=A0A5C7FVN4_9BACT|nr:hypothetical protein [Neolewinella aurantiaca]TXF90405.1 hypothetical protein FUA23_06335 [Neolewinella aurantiaca]
MAIFNDLKKLFFGAKSVAKHQASKASEAAGGLADELKDKAGDLLDDAKAAASDLADKAPGYVDQGKEALEDLSDKIWREADAAVDKGKELKDKASEAINAKLDDLNPKPEPVDLDAEIGLSLEDLGMTEVSQPAAPKSGSIDFEEGLIEDSMGKVKDAATGLKDAAGDAFNKVKDATAGVRGAAAEAADTGLNAAAKAGAGLKDQAEILAGKVGDVSEVVGAKVLEKGSDILDRGAEIGADLKGKASDFIDHANVEAEKMKMEETIEEAKRAAEVAEARARAFDGKEGARDTSESTLSGTDSFFDRAARFAEGDYANEGGKDMQIKDNPDAKPKEKGGLIAGFLDSDGDGDSLIDDAEVIDEE